ncbi:hypothetical protein ACP4OV_031858 [Aristida adscensionis]
MNHRLELGMPFQAQWVNTISPSAPYAPARNGEGHQGQQVGQALEPRSRVDEEGRKDDRKRKGKEVVVEDGDIGPSRGKRILIPMRCPVLLPLFPAPPEPHESAHYAANTQGISWMPYDENNMPLKMEHDFMQNCVLPKQSFHPEGSSQGSRKPKRFLSKEQSATLEEIFKTNRAPIPEEREGIAQMLGICRTQVDVWFQNRRKRDKMAQVELEKDRLQKRVTELEKELKFCKSYHSMRAITKQPFYPFHEVVQNLMPAQGLSRKGSNEPRRALPVATSSDIVAGPSTVPSPSLPPPSSTWFPNTRRRHQYPYTR